MEKVKTYPYDPADYLTSHEAIVVFIQDAFETQDAVFIAKALGVAVRAKGMTEIARKTGLSRESLYRALNAEGNLGFVTILKVMKALDLKITVTAA